VKTATRSRRVLRRIRDQRHTGTFARLTLACGHEVGHEALVGVRTEGFAACAECAVAGQPRG